MNAIASQPHTSCSDSKDTISEESLLEGRTVPKITTEVPEELSEQLAQIGDRLPELLRLR